MFSAFLGGLNMAVAGDGVSPGIRGEGIGKKKVAVLAEKMKVLPYRVWRMITEVGRNDPKIVLHSLKVGVSLTLVSLLYLIEPLFKGFGQSAIWAVMTVVVVLEYTAGATLCKGLNRGLGTVLAGSLAFLMEYIANASGHVFRALFIGTAVFLTGALATYMRFFPRIKKNYDYGVLIFILTFNLITVSSYRVDNVLRLAHERFSTIAIGCAVCLLMSLLIFPNWSGEALHDSMVYKLQGLAKSVEACVDQYFNDGEGQEKKVEGSEDPIYKGYKAVLDSKSSEETLALHANWEPRHSIHCYRFPGQQYVKLGAALRHFGYTIVALHGCLQTEIQTPQSVRALFKDPCIRVAAEVSKVLRELAESIRSRHHCGQELLSDHLHEALQDLNRAVRSQPRLFLGSNKNQATNMLALAAATATAGGQKRESKQQSGGVSLSSVKTDTSALMEWKNSKREAANEAAERKVLRPTLSKLAITSLEFSEALPLAAFASLLVETVARLDLVIEEVEELARVANFREYKRPSDGDDHGRVAVVVCDDDQKKRRKGGDGLHSHLHSNGVE